MAAQEQALRTRHIQRTVDRTNISMIIAFGLMILTWRVQQLTRSWIRE